MSCRRAAGVVIGALCIALAGCSSLANTGVSTFEASPYTSKDGTIVCCAMKVVSGKEYANLTAHVSKGADGSIVLDLQENGTKAFTGTAIAANTATASVEAVAKVAAVAINPTSGLVAGAGTAIGAGVKVFTAPAVVTAPAAQAPVAAP
jgi:hypothetical protein